MKNVENAISKAIRYRRFNVLITETFDLARKQAEEAERKGLEPFPLVVKDCYTVEGVRMTCASKMLSNYVPPYTATVVQRLVDKGGCVIGKANMDEFSMGTSSVLGHFGPVKGGLSDETKLDEDWLIAGGSSGGSAVSVQLGIARIALGSDTGGSTRNPAALNGVWGYKPTWGAFSRYGLVPLVNSMDAPSLVTATADDCRLFAEMLCGRDERDPTSLSGVSVKLSRTSLEGLTIEEYHNEALTEEAWQVWNRAANVLKRAGAIVKTVSLPHTKYSLTCYHVLSHVDIASNMARYDGIRYGFRSSDKSSSNALYAASRSEALNLVVRRRVLAGNYFLMREHRTKYFEKALKIRQKISQELRALLEGEGSVDALLTPVTAGSALRHSEMSNTDFQRENDDDFYTQPANLAGVPALSVPVAASQHGLPIGVQLLTGRLKDSLLLDIGKLLHSSYK